MAKSKGFVLYHDMLDSFSRLETDSERWQLLTALIHYSANDCQDSNDDYSNLSPMAQGMYIAMTAPIRAQYQEYRKLCERNKVNRAKADDKQSPVVTTDDENDDSSISSPVVTKMTSRQSGDENDQSSPNAPVVNLVTKTTTGTSRDENDQSSISSPVVTNKQNKINKQTKSVCQKNKITLTNNWGATKLEIVDNLKKQLKYGEEWNFRKDTKWDTLSDEIIDIIADRLILSAQGPYVYEGTTYDQESTSQLVSQLTPGILHSLLMAYNLNKARVRSPEHYIWSAVIDQVRQLRMRQVPTQSADNSD